MIGLAARLLGRPEEELAREAAVHSFTALGGTSLLAMTLVAEAGRQAGRVPELAALLGRRPLAEVLAEAAPLVSAAGQEPPPGGRPLLPAQEGILFGESLGWSSAYHLLFSLRSSALLDEGRLGGALQRLVDRHESLRTVFEPSDGEAGPRRRVLPRGRPYVLRQVLRPAPGVDPVEQVHRQLGAAGARLLHPFARPPVVFALTEVRPDGGEPWHLVSLLVHHALVDGWAIGLLLRELGRQYREPDDSPGPSPELAARRHQALSESGRLEELTRRRVEQLAGAPTSLNLPTDLGPSPRHDGTGVRIAATLSPEAVTAWREAARRHGVTGTVVLLAAYALVLARRTGGREVLIGLAGAARPTPELAEVVAACSRVAPVRCVIDDKGGTGEYIASVAEALADAVAAQEVPFERLVDHLNAHGGPRSPLVQAVLGVHDELLPERVSFGETDAVVHEGHCGGAPFELSLFLQRGGGRPRLVLEYGSAVLTPAEAADLLDSLDAALVELAAGGPLGEARTVSAAQHRRLLAARSTPGDVDADVWSLVAGTARRHPGAPAVRDADGRTLDYARLVAAAEAQAHALATRGVRAGQLVAIAQPRSAAEIVAVLAVLRLGAGYVGVDPGLPETRLRAMLETARPAAVVGPEPVAARLAALAPEGCAAVPPLDPFTCAPAPSPEAGAEPSDVAYVAFTSGSTGVPKGVRVPHRAIARLVAGPDPVAPCGPGERMLRLAPLAFDASTLEIFGPLAGGGCVEVYPPGVPSPPDLAAFLAERDVTVLWLTAGLFRIMADLAPEAFGRVRQVLTGGDVVPPAQVRALLRRRPGLRVTNGYGPTENTTFTTVYHADSESDVDDPLPIGTAIPGTGTIALDADGRIVPPGGVGELYATGSGLALGYLGGPDEAFSLAAPGDGARTYRTGDLVRLDGQGRWRYLGRRDQQVKIRGFRIELEEVVRPLLEHPGVRDAVVVTVGADADSRRLLAAVVPAGPADASDLVRQVHAEAARTLPGYAVPSLWAVVPEIPITANGKVDRAGLERVARPAASAEAPSDAGTPATESQGHPAPAEPAQETTAEGPPAGTPEANAAEGPPAGTPERIAFDGWRAALGRPPRHLDADFFASGGDSLAMARLVGWLKKEHGVRISLAELYRKPTAGRLTDLVRSAVQETSR
ncbi:non-ribosomal peptide synthetase [Thermoactinospora rubra]|uniref:non-ribosomal peptide synthetase n=1 Tax=Thermoactinospora rubra TaxID=1088767 RepID=UPI000A0FED38|nr:non-ribosomal peptide synthetase [Thermoactinospora rubra]